MNSEGERGSATVVVRLWRGPDGGVRASARPTGDDGKVHYFRSLTELARFLESRVEARAPPGLR